MYPTPYLPLQSLGKAPEFYNGGFCRWWYTPIENIASFPAIDPTNQRLAGEPILHDGKTWYGPVNVSDKYLGWKETQERSPAGIYFKEKVQGLVTGIESGSHVNLWNMAGHQYCIIGKLRAGGFYIILGNNEVGLDFDHETHSGEGAGGNPGSEFAFTGEQSFKTLVVSSFAGDNSLPPLSGEPPVIGGDDGGCCEPEIIPFTDKGQILIAYTSARRERFGAFPSIDVWSDQGEGLELTPAQILVDAPAPNQTLFTIRISSGLDGFVRLS